ncbi:MAG: hypothetical protein U0797_21675 [Gemmataceae bacterium]
MPDEQLTLPPDDPFATLALLASPREAEPAPVAFRCRTPSAATGSTGCSARAA